MGNLVFELAQANGTRSCRIYCMSRYYYEEGELKDAVSESPDNPSVSFQKQGRKGEWALIELLPLRERLADGTLCLPENPELNRVKFLAENFDFVLITPADEGQRPNYDKNE
ncbi:MAG: hypothetical protein J5I98_23055 [Phaeodactylibacter sp.]|nr:hypothetical protein [Phaeodactylibacter sp.]